MTDEQSAGRAAPPAGLPDSPVVAREKATTKLLEALAALVEETLPLLRELREQVEEEKERAAAERRARARQAQAGPAHSRSGF